NGQHLLVPIFSENVDTFESVASRSAFLFDAIVSIGCRAEEGFSSATYRLLQARLREHLTEILIDCSTRSTLETVQAVAIMAGYSENGSVLIAIALRFAIESGLPETVNELMDLLAQDSGIASAEEENLYRITRIWYGVCNLELFFSLDGGKLPGITVDISSRRIRALVKHPASTAVDIRLLSQVELNIIRVNAYRIIATQCAAAPLSDGKELRTTVNDSRIELRLWLEEWTAIISADTVAHQRSFALLNLHIQYEWAWTTLHLKALSDFGIENIAIMADFQRDMVRTAKEAASRHLQLLLEASSSPASPTASPVPSQDGQMSTYLTTFKWTMDYVWAKCAFSVLLVLKLAFLLREPPAELMRLLRDAHKVLGELEKVTTGHIAYFSILQTSVEKCDGALREYMSQQSTVPSLLESSASREEGASAEDDFQRYAPGEFVFEWDFPGLNLRNVPLGWQDLFIDLDNVL
ncbi:C6 zinc finger domain-containing protein, partial [Polyplosphaeria fusca]